MSEMTAEQVARRYNELYNDGTPDSYGSDRFLELYAENVVAIDYPMPLSPEGRRDEGLAAVRKGLEEAQALLRNRKTHLHEVLAQGDRVVMRFTWEATVAVDGMPVPKGTVVRMECVQFFTVANGKITRDESYSALLPPA